MPLFTDDHMDQAVERLIIARATHLDSLAARLHEPRVKRIVEPLIAGAEIEVDATCSDDLAYLRDLGLIGRRRRSGKCFSISACALAGPGVSTREAVVGGGVEAEADERHGDHADDPSHKDEAAAPVTEPAQLARTPSLRGIPVSIIIFSSNRH